MSASEHLQLFARQLFSWAEQIIKNGRTPFRRVDLFHPLLTSLGTCQPPLIFWINRQSMIAGGLVFLPDDTTDGNFSIEAAAAEALGLRNFVTWDAREVKIWETSATGNTLITSLSLATTADPAISQQRLYELIDQLKLLSITGRIEAQQVSPFYLLNLIEETLALSFPVLLEHCRLQRSEIVSILPAEEAADNWNRLTMLRALCLFNWQQMPSDLPIENFFSSADKLLALLPEPLAQLLPRLKPVPSEKLPGDSSVAFHHLLLRLQQIGWRGLKDRGETVLRLLLKHWYGEITGGDSGQKLPRLLLHSPELAPLCLREISHSGAQLAANALWRSLTKRAHPEQLQGDAFKFSQPFPEKILHANFYGSLRPEPALRRELAGHLRISWPNRHLVIPGNFPFWSIEAAHILGLSAQNSQIELHLPENWLRLLADSFFSELLFSNFMLETVDCRHGTRSLLRLYHRQGEILTECLLADGSRRALELGHDHRRAAIKLLYALELPPPIFELFNEQRLVPLTTEGAEASYLKALNYYALSGMGQQLWKLRTQSSPPTTTEALLDQGEELGWLVPEASHLKELESLTSRQEEIVAGDLLDSLMMRLFDMPANVAIVNFRTLKQTENGAKPPKRQFQEELLLQLKTEGIPTFPQSYLYRQATGPLSCYRFVPPLKLYQELLGEFELEDATGQRFRVIGEETKEALLLASSLELTELEIPRDRQQTAEMIDSYRQDLLTLQEKMIRLCFRHIEQPPAAQRLHKKLWQQLPLPPLKWLSH